MTADTLEQALALARELGDEINRDDANEPSFKADIKRLCDLILSDDLKCDIENAAYERAAYIAKHRISVDRECDALSPPDPETGVSECATENNRGICLCSERIEEAELIFNRLRALIQPPAQKENGE